MAEVTLTTSAPVATWRDGKKYLWPAALLPVTLVVISPTDPDAMSRYAEECRTHGIPFLFDPGSRCESTRVLTFASAAMRPTSTVVE